MSDLERFAGAILARWRSRGGHGGGPIGVGALLDQVFPYRAARRLLAIDVSEDYEALVLRLIAEEDGCARVEPVEAADMARTTIGSKLPDLDVLQLLRSASITIADRVVPLPIDAERQPRSEWAARSESPADAAAQSDHAGSAAAAPEAAAAIDAEPAPLHAVREEPPMAADQTADSCWSCGEPLPAGRNAKFCPFCGADQRAPTCPACGGLVERRWKHCPDCGARLWSDDHG